MLWVLPGQFLLWYLQASSLYPAGGVYLFFIPIEIPSPIFGILYLFYSAYMARRGRDNIGHDAHFWGAIYGIILTIALKPQCCF